MHIITFQVFSNEDTDPEGEALLFDTQLMVITLEDGKKVISGGQDGMLKWLKNNDLFLKYPNIVRKDKPTDREDSMIRLGLTGQPKHKIQDDDGNNLTISIPWSINNHGGLELTRYVGMIQPKLTPWVMVVDGDVAAFMNIKDFNKPHYGVTDYEGGGHNFWIPFMMAGGRSGVGYIIVLYLPDLQAGMVLDALKRKGDKEGVMTYINSTFPKSPLPEFEDRMVWM